MSVVAIVVTAAILFAAYVAWLAARLTRLHQRVAAAQAVLDMARFERARAAAVLVEALREDTVQRPQLAAAIVGCVSAEPMQRAHAENELTKALRGAKVSFAADGGEPPAWVTVADAHRRLEVARQMYNDAVRDTVVLRGRRLPRALRLAAPGDRPGYFDINTDLS